MRKKIFLYSFLLGAAVLVICAILFFGIQYSQTIDETYEAMKGEAKYAASGIETGGIDFLKNIENINRITWISGDGDVLYDSEFSEHPANQKDYPEISSALEKGEGKAIRKSGPGGINTMYYAFRCANGTVLRLSRPRSALSYALEAVSPVLWVFILVLAISGVFAFKVAKQILKPINGMDLDSTDPGDTYPELAPLVKRIHDQKETIRKEAEQREDLRKEFSANVSHELKTPLTSISGFAELMSDGLVPQEKMKEFSGDIYKESQRLIALVDDIMRLSKLDEEAGLPEPEECDLHEISGEILHSLESIAGEKSISMDLSGTGAVVNGVKPVISEMIYNLADNAIKYNRYGGYVHILTGYLGGSPFVSVEDNGIGIEKSEQERIFERFYRVDKSHSKAVGGTGLGLSIVKHGARLHNADIKLDSEPGKGTKITLIFHKKQ